MAKSSNSSHSGDPASQTSLSGRTIVITRASHQADALRLPLERFGANVIAHPVIQIGPPADFSELDRAIASLDLFDWLVFVSTNAVRFFVDRYVELEGSTVPLQGLKIAAIGSATAKALKTSCEIEADLIPASANGESLGAELVKLSSGQKLLIPRANRRSPALTQVLTSGGIDFEESLTYVSSDVDSPDPGVLAKLAGGEVDWMTITSPAIARASVRVFGDALQNTKLVAISPGTTAALIDLGFPPATEAVEFSMSGVVAAIVAYPNA